MLIAFIIWFVAYIELLHGQCPDGRLDNGVCKLLATDIPIGAANCYLDGSCPVFECGRTEDCTLTCGHSQCRYVFINFYNGNIEMTCNGNNAGCNQARITAHDTASFTFTGSSHVGTISTFGTGNVIINNLRDATSLWINGEHQYVEINIGQWGKSFLSAINAKNLVINMAADAYVSFSKIYLPISKDSSITVNDRDNMNYDLGSLFALRGMETITFKCNGVDGGYCSNSQNLYMFYGIDYNSVCSVLDGECGGIDTNIGTALDDYTVVYVDDDTMNVDFSNDNDNKLVFWSYLGSAPNKNTLIGPNDANIIVQCFGTIYSNACYHISYDFSPSNNAIMGNGEFYHSTITGPKHSFLWLGYYWGHSRYNTFNLQNTNTIDIRAYSDDRVSGGNTLYAPTTLNVGNNEDMNIKCGTGTSTCGTNAGSKPTIHSTLNPLCTALKPNWLIENAYVQVEFDQTGDQCAVSSADETCGGFFRTDSNLGANCPTPPPDCIVNAATFDWDDLTENGNGIPDFNYDMKVQESDLSLKITVALQYMGFTSADNKDALWGTTYVLDFESFNAHKNAIYAPGSCENRRKEDFYDGETLKDFEKWWKYSTDPMGSGQIGAPGDYLAYPPTNTDKWTISMGDGASCGYVVYEGHFAWQELRDCDDGSVGGASYTEVTQDENWLNLTGNFYINIVSPFDYDDDFDYYRIYQILSQPFVIAVSKTVYVLGSAGINLLTMSIIAVYKEDDENTFRLIVLTESSDYLKLSRSSTDLAGFTGSAGLSAGDFVAVTTSVTDAERLANTPSGCLSNKDFLCSQLWEIRAENVNCNKNPNGIDFSGKYALKFNTECRSSPDVDADSATHCNTWLPAHTQIANGVTLEADLVWKDEICDPLVFKEQFKASMDFYIDQGFGTKASSDHLYQVGESQIYIEITTTFPTATFDVFDTKLMNVWICTFDPNYYDSVIDPDPNEFKGGCYDINRDGKLVEDGNKYFYHIYAGSVGSEKEEFKLIGHPGSNDDDKNKLRFYFTVPHEIARDRLYIHAQIEVSLTELNRRRRRRLLVNTGTSVANQIDHFMDFVGIDDGTEPKKEPIGDNNNYEPQQPFNYNPPQQAPMNPVINTPKITTWTISLSSPWILIIGGLLTMILIFNIGFLCYFHCFQTKTQRNRISFNSRRRSGYSSVKHGVDSEYDDSENSPINNA